MTVANTAMSTRNVNASTVPLGSKNQPVAPSPRIKRPATDKSHITTRDNLNSKVVPSPKTTSGANGSKTPSKYASGIAAANRSGDGVAMALGKSTSGAAAATAAGNVSNSTTSASAAAGRPVTANKQYQMALKQQQSEMGVAGARRKRLAVSGQISSTAALAGCGTPPPEGNSTATKEKGTAGKKCVPGTSGSTGGGGLFAGLGASASAPSSQGRHHKDPNDTRFAGAAGVPSGRTSGKASITTANGEGKPIPSNVLRKNTTVAGAAGSKSTDREKLLDRVHKKGIVHAKPGETHVNVLGGSSTVPVEALLSSLANGNSDSTSAAPNQKPSTPELHTSKRLIPGKSNISPYRGGVSPMRSVSGAAGKSFVSKPYATTEENTNGNNNGNISSSGGHDLGATTSGLNRSFTKKHSVSHQGVHQTNQSSLIGVFKADPALIKTRTANHVAPWERNERPLSVSAKGRATSTIKHAARQTHMDGVFTVPDASTAVTGASVGSSNVMARGSSPYRGGAAPSVTTRQSAPAETTAAAPATNAPRPASSSRRYAVTPSSSSTRPVWAMSPRPEQHRPGLGGTSFRRVATSTAAPWATD